MNKKFLPYFLGIFGVVLIWKMYEFSIQSDFKIEKSKKDVPVVAPVINKSTDELNRSATHFIYTKHARCRMDCRHIDESEVKEILKDGAINYKKSQYQHTDNPKYAVEGWSHDKQHLRIVFAPTEDAVVVVTCIDLENEFECHCPGDEHKN
ncbi:MAG: DUF4258 domain-containing protein [Sphingobacteriales bacterium]|nr:DUF4258 domain-containing protein [Sphingobacteriales bacterium]MBI3719879.1 DUF4258 domain-containing protein [Sphingobacteriales bacterium]